MNFIYQIYDLLAKLEAVTPDFVLFGVLGLMFLAMVLPLLLGAGEMGKFASAAKKVVTAKNADPNASVKDIVAKGGDNFLAKYRVWHRSGGARPDDIITLDSMVVAPYSASVLKATSGIVRFVMMVGMLLTFAWSVLYMAMGLDGLAVANPLAEVEPYIYVIVIVATGLLLTVLGAVFARMRFKSAVRAHCNLMTVLASGAQPQAEPAAYQAVHAQPAAQYHSIEPDADVAEPVVEATAFDGGFAYNAEAYQVADEPVSEPEIVSEPVVEYNYAAFEPEVEPFVVEEDNSAAEEAAARAAAEEAAARAAAEEAAARAAEEAAARAAAEEAARAAAAEAAARAAAEAAARAAAEAAANANSAVTEDLLSETERIVRDGAPMERMREVAKLLQAERAKPENKTPDQQRRLNEALGSLLKAMSAAKK